MNFLDKLMAKTRGGNKIIVLPEGQDQRVRQAAAKIAANQTARLVVLVDEDDKKMAAQEGVEENDRLSFHDYLNSEYQQQLAEQLHRKRQAKGWSLEKCQKLIKNRLYFANMMVEQGLADGMVAGSVASTPDMLRAAFHCVGMTKGIKVGSSCFVMDLLKPAPAGDDVLIYADCGVNPNPTAEQLADIAIASAHTHSALIGGQQRLAFLSFSTNGSAQHHLVEKVVEATKITKKRVANEKLDILVDGELQADAAIVPEVAAAKCPKSPLQGRANILIFPDLQAGNICYKITERLAGAVAYGPVLQGLASPINDLSRGCRVEDIVGVVTITVCQAQAKD